MSEIAPGIHMIDLQFRGTPQAIAAYMLVGENGDAALIETGPTSTLPALYAGFDRLHIARNRIRDILVTHIHLDHAGAAGVLARTFPDARVWVHPVGAPHLIDPARLIASATRLYGDEMDRLWGEIAPVPEQQVRLLHDKSNLTLAGHETRIHDAPGHAAHHVVVQHLASGLLFAGDAAGVRTPGVLPVTPPTVPPEFDLDAWIATLDLITALAPRGLLATHFGLHTDVETHLASLRERLYAWVTLIRAGLAADQSIAEIAASLRQRDDLTNPTHGIVSLVASYDISTAGIIRYLTKHPDR